MAGGTAMFTLLSGAGRMAGMDATQLEKVRSGRGFFAALDQSGGSTPKALAEYGIDESRYTSEEEMFDLVHAMRTRVITDPAFDGSRILAAILFEQTMERDMRGVPTARYLWAEKQVVPFLKVDKGLAAEQSGVQLMKPIDTLDELLERANRHQIFGTKMRSVINDADTDGVAAIADQQFEYGARISAAGLVPILEPEVSIDSPRKDEAELLLRDALQSAHRGAARRRRRHAETDHPDPAGPLRRSRRRPAGRAGPRPVRRLQPRPGVRAAGQGPEHDREFLPGTARGTVRPADRRAVPRAAGRLGRADLRRLRGQGAGRRLRGSRPGPSRGRAFVAHGAVPSACACPPAVQGRSLSGLRTAQMCLIRPPATSNAYTATVTPSCWATRPGWPLTVRSRIVTLRCAWPAMSTR